MQRTRRRELRKSSSLPSRVPSMKIDKRICFVLGLVAGVLLAIVPGAAGQALGVSNEKGATFYQRFSGSSDSAGVVTRLDSTLGYNFNKYFAVDAGLPVYFIHASDSTGGLVSTNGIGNFYVDARLTFENPVVNFVTNLRGTAPTGDSARGLSTGHATYDWTNHFDRSFGRFTPYAELGVANTVSDTPYYLRPFSSFGVVGHFQAGLGVHLSRFFAVSASAYDVAPTGQQKLYSRFVPRRSGSSPGSGSGTGSGKGMGVAKGIWLPADAPGSHGRVYETSALTVGSAGLASDNGFFAGVNISPTSYLDLGGGYSRSVHFQENSAFFGIGINVGYLWKKSRGY